MDEAERYWHDLGFDEGWQEGYEEGLGAGLTVHTVSRADRSRNQAVKVLEEASEVFAAREALQAVVDGELGAIAEAERMNDLALEVADLIIAACGLSDAWGLDLQAALHDKARINEERGY